VAERLPAAEEELGALFAETIAAGDQLGFLLLAAAALDGGRRVDAEHLVKGIALIPNSLWLGNLAWKMEGDVPGALLVALKQTVVSIEMHAAAIFIAAAWCAERRGDELPTGLMAEARQFTRVHGLKKETFLYLAATALQVKDEDFLAVLRGHAPLLVPGKVDDNLTRTAATELLKTFVLPLITLIPETPPKLLANGRTMRRAVEKLGRNDFCHCGSGRKYKRCCFEQDQERLHLSTGVAGKTAAELRAEPEAGLTEQRIKGMPAFELARIDPRKVPEALRNIYIEKTACLQVFERAAEFFEVLEWNEESAVQWNFALFYVMRAQRKDIAERMVAVRARHEPVEEDLRGGGRLLLAREDPAGELQVLAETAQEILRERDPDELMKLIYGVVCSRHTALGILICRSLIPLLPPNEAGFLLQQILEARDKLNLPPDDPFSDVLEKRLAEETPDEGTDAAALRAARKRLDAKAEEVRDLNEKIERQRRELDRR